MLEAQGIRQEHQNSSLPVFNNSDSIFSINHEWRENAYSEQGRTKTYEFEAQIVTCTVLEFIITSII